MASLTNSSCRVFSLMEVSVSYHVRNPKANFFPSVSGTERIETCVWADVSCIKLMGTRLFRRIFYW